MTKCGKCGAEFEAFDLLKDCPECQPTQGQRVQQDCYQYMRSAGVGYRLIAGFRLQGRSS